jgi:D-alanyl-D-alanine dipeptidase
VPRFDDVPARLDDLDRVPLPAVTGEAPLPVEPEAMPRGPVAEFTGLVPVAGPRLTVRPVYALAGWAAARDEVLARPETVAALVDAAGALPDGFGLCVLDAWRPLALQAELHAAAYADSALPEGFVSVADSDPATPPPHLTGGTVDLTLTFEARPLRLGTDFDDFTPEAAAAAFEEREGPVRQLRRLLRGTMHEAGFCGLQFEWWHFELGTRRWAVARGREPRFGPARPAPPVTGPPYSYGSRDVQPGYESTWAGQGEPWGRDPWADEG